MLSIQSLSFYYGSRALYDDASLHIKPKDRIGIVGPNGAGKSTLLKIIDGQLQPDSGSIQKVTGMTLGFLNQDLLSFQSEEPILHVAMQAFGPVLKLQEQIDQVLLEMETEYSDELLNRLTKLQDEFQAADGYNIEHKAEEVLEGLGFTTADLKRPLEQFSGGWRMRVMLAKMLLQKPDLLMLDEPTNHLDMPSIEWIENYLNGYDGAVLIVSHDQEFINGCCNKIVEVSGAKLNLYVGNYDSFLEQKAERIEIQRNAFKNQQQKIKQTEAFIERFRAKATKSRQVQSRVKMLEKMDTVEDVEISNAAINMKFEFKTQPGKIIAELKNASKAYGDKIIFTDSNATIERGDKIAFIGANGKGKSTLLRMIAGTEDFEGERRTGYNVIPSFYAQHQLESLTLENEILEEMKQTGVERTEAQFRNVLGCFLFAGNDVYKKIKVLSGGEKSRVALAKTLVSEANFLILDEPTNHLDIQSVNILIRALQNYQGTFVVVSHDRFFVSAIANKIWYIEDQQLKEYPGTFEEYHEWLERRNTEKDSRPAPAKPSSDKKPEKASETKKTAPKAKQTEEILFELELEKEALEAELAKPSVFSNPELLAQYTLNYRELQRKIEELA
jgi:ATP-binding cassette subfamily F protein 3